MKLIVLDTGINEATQNMAIDKQLLAQLDPNGCVMLHLYDWLRPSLTYGYFTKPEQVLNLEAIKKHRLDISKRITGGGVTFHFSDFAFSLLVPKNSPYFSENTLQNYAFVNQFVVKVLTPYIDEQEKIELLTQQECSKDLCFNFCMAKPTVYDVVYRGRKLGGAAQRKTAQGFLHHGTISIALPDKTLLNEILLNQDQVAPAIYQNSYYFVESHLNTKELQNYREQFQSRLIEQLEKY